MTHYSMENKTVLITGASSGIGLACARLFAAEGSKLILVARRNALLESIKDELISLYPQLHVLILSLDIQNFSQIDQAISMLPEEFATIDILINNAGLALGMETVSQLSLENIERVIDTNVKGVLYITKAILPQMLKRTSPSHIIMIGSVSGTQTYPRGSVYCASKHALHAISESLRKELIATPIRVTEIQPGLVETEFSLVRFGGDQAAAKNVYSGIEPLTAEDIAEAVLFSASRRPNVQVASMLLFPTAQASVSDIHRQ